MGLYDESLAEGSVQHCGSLAIYPPMPQPVLTQDLAICWLPAPVTTVAMSFPLS